MIAHRIFLALGTNLGSRLDNLRAALHCLPPDVLPLRASPVYETLPWGIVDQPDFLNQVVECDTNLPPLDLLAYLKTLEVTLGRVASQRYGPRLIDLDILFYDRLVLKTDRLTIPHPRVEERAFVLVPLADLVPDFRHPVNGLTVTSLLARLEQTTIKPCPLPAGFDLLPGPNSPGLSADIAAALLQHLPAAAMFFNLPPAHRREHLHQITGAIKPETRRQRIEKMIDGLVASPRSERD